MAHQKEIGVRIPQIRDPLAAIRLFYSKTELSTGDIRELFAAGKGKRISGERALKLKKLAREAMHEKGIPSYDATKCNTDVAYEVWGINIADLERRYAKLQKYGGCTAVAEEAVS